MSCDGSDAVSGALSDLRRTANSAQGWRDDQRRQFDVSVLDPLIVSVRKLAEALAAVEDAITAADGTV